MPELAGQASSGFTKIPDVVLDYWMPHLSEPEFKVLCYILRRTYGFGKSEDVLSVSQMCAGIVRKKEGRTTRPTNI